MIIDNVHVERTCFSFLWLQSDRDIDFNLDEPCDWLLKQIQQQEDLQKQADSKNLAVVVPLKSNGSKFVVADLHTDQVEIFAVIIAKVKEWMTCTDFKTFKPLRMIIQGAGGSGKSVLINTLVTILREMFCSNDVVSVLAPTGVAAFNVGGETIHHCLGIGKSKSEYLPNTLSKDKADSLKNKFKNLLALIIDERSMLSSKLFGMVDQLLSETIHFGRCSHIPFGNLPILILVGDDYQLPSIERGCWHIRDRELYKTYSKLVQQGENAFEECAQFVMQLTGLKRQREGDDEARNLNKRLRVGYPSDDDVKKLISLDLDNIKAKHGQALVNEIKKDAIFLLAKNEHIVEHNFNMLAKVHSKERPVAFIRARSTGPCGGLAINKHFELGSITSTIICRGATVSIAGRNFFPAWGLHNGAVGIVEDIIYRPNESPNKEDLPLYVVVCFPSYVGPVWDKKNPKVSRMSSDLCFYDSSFLILYVSCF